MLIELAICIGFVAAAVDVGRIHISSYVWLISHVDCYLQSPRLGFSLTSSRCTAMLGLGEKLTCSNDCERVLA
jgi:hypothetical protein